jgi:Mycothiol maleylpyruvate isomerase N-terminal domain
MPEPSVLRALVGEWQEIVSRPDSGRPFRRGGPPFPTTAAGLFAELEEVLLLWRELRTMPLRRHARRFVNAAWTLRDLLAHLASWAAEFRREVETAAAGREPDYAIPFALSVMGPNEWNQAEVESRRSLSLAEVLDQFETETRRLQDVVLALSPPQILRLETLPAAPSGDPAARMKGNVAIVVAGKCRHDRYHIGMISRWLEGLEPARSKKKE